MHSLSYLLPAVVGVFTDTDGSVNEASKAPFLNLDHMRHLPHVVRHTHVRWCLNTQYLKNHVDRNNKNYDTLFGSKATERENLDAANYGSESEEAMKTRLEMVLTILHNLSMEDMPLSSQNPIINLLTICINSDIEQSARVAWQTIENLSAKLQFTAECAQIRLLISTISDALLGYRRLPILSGLSVVINLVTFDQNQDVAKLFNNFDVSSVIELLGVCDAQVITIALMALQVLTVIIAPIKYDWQLLLYLNGLAHFVTYSDTMDPFVDERMNSGTNLGITEKFGVDRTTQLFVQEWFDSNYEKTSYYTHYITLYDIFCDLHSHCLSVDHGNDCEACFLALRGMFPYVGVLLEGTLESCFSFKNWPKTMKLLKNSVSFPVNYRRRSGAKNEYSEPLNCALYRLQISRICRQNRALTIFGLGVTFPTACPIPRPLNDSKDSTIVELGLQGSDEEQEGNRESTTTEKMRTNATELMAKIAATTISNICFSNSAIGRLVVKELLHTMLESNLDNNKVMSILLRITV